MNIKEFGNAILAGLREHLSPCQVMFCGSTSTPHDQATSSKWPDPFPTWALATSQFCNVVWAAKYGKRGQPNAADHAMSCACGKLRRPRLNYSAANTRVLLSELPGSRKLTKH